MRLPEVSGGRDPRACKERVNQEGFAKVKSRRGQLVPDIAADWQSKLLREIKRKAIHLTGLSVPFGILVFGRTFTATLIALALVVALILEAQRLKGKIRLPEVRDQEEKKVASYIYYISGSLLCVLLFPPMIAVTAMLLLSLGDTISGLAGSILENANVRGCNEKWRIKPLPIVTTMFAACLVIGYLASGLTRLPFPVYLAGAVGATVADSVAIIFCNRSLDDNFTIPIFAGALMSAAVLIL
jgi:dolichol kinase